jgi:hypothetical protein
LVNGKWGALDPDQRAMLREALDGVTTARSG